MANSATISGAIKQLIEGAGLGLSAYRDRKPPQAVPPYVVITESLSLVPDSLETSDTDSAYRTGRELVQVDLWQNWKNPASDAIVENYTLAPSLVRLLEGAQLPAAPQVVYGAVVTNTIRQLEPDNNLVRHSLTVRVMRQL